MSEYQYYEFLAIDRPLTEEEIDELRWFSTRATITPTSFANEYIWGNFKGDPEKLTQRDRKQREIQRREKRKAYLEILSSDFSKAWALVKECVEGGSARGYDEACRILVDIAEAYDLFATKKQFQNELKKFMAGHLRRKALIQRFVKAGIWEGL
jgi:hypothetical protein